jgi:hypothetical protein
MNEQLEYRLGEIDDERRCLEANIRQIQAKLGELAGEAYGLKCEIAREQDVNRTD